MERINRDDFHYIAGIGTKYLILCPNCEDISSAHHDDWEACICKRCSALITNPFRESREEE